MGTANIAPPKSPIFLSSWDHNVDASFTKKTFETLVITNHLHLA